MAMTSHPTLRRAERSLLSHKLAGQSGVHVNEVNGHEIQRSSWDGPGLSATDSEINAGDYGLQKEATMNDIGSVPGAVPERWAAEKQFEKSAPEESLFTLSSGSYVGSELETLTEPTPKDIPRPVSASHPAARSDAEDNRADSLVNGRSPHPTSTLPSHSSSSSTLHSNRDDEVLNPGQAVTEPIRPGCKTRFYAAGQLELQISRPRVFGSDPRPASPTECCTYTVEWLGIGQSKRLLLHKDPLILDLDTLADKDITCELDNDNGVYIASSDSMVRVEFSLPTVESHF